MGKIDDVLEKAIDKSLNHNNTFDVFKWVDNKEELKQSLYKAIESIVNECFELPPIYSDCQYKEGTCHWVNSVKQELLDKLKKKLGVR